MKVTIEIDDELADRLREMASTHGDDLSAAVSGVLRAALHDHSFEMVTFGEGGLNPDLQAPIQKSSAVIEEVEAADASL